LFAGLRWSWCDNLLGCCGYNHIITLFCADGNAGFSKKNGRLPPFHHHTYGMGMIINSEQVFYILQRCWYNRFTKLKA
ncbi:MAG: hypothetical protein K2O11_09215, partial [Oscillospiraceae bacterium]|nr:hypothetical protein [Oscillospiraceae bacterium]